MSGWSPSLLLWPKPVHPYGASGRGLATPGVRSERAGAWGWGGLDRHGQHPETVPILGSMPGGGPILVRTGIGVDAFALGAQG